MQKSILVVDDDTVFLKMMSRILGDSDKYHVYTANRALEALDMLSNEIDLVILDIYFFDNDKNDIDGIECLSLFREKGYDGIICMYTGDPSPTLLFQAVLAGADDYIVKGEEYDICTEIEKLLKHDAPAGTGEKEGFSIDCAFLRSRGLTQQQVDLLDAYAEYGYPRIKEFANRMGISETSLWKRLSRIRDKLGMDSMSQITHLMTSITILNSRMEKRRRSQRTDDR